MDGPTVEIVVAVEIDLRNAARDPVVIIVVGPVDPGPSDVMDRAPVVVHPSAKETAVRHKIAARDLMVLPVHAAMIAHVVPRTDGGIVRMKNVRAFPKAGSCACCQNPAPWMHWPNRSRLQAGRILFLMSPNFSSPQETATCCTFITSHCCPIKVRRRMRRPRWRHPVSCSNARWMAHSGSPATRRSAMSVKARR